MIVYRVYNEKGGYTEYSEEPQGMDFEIIDKTPTTEEIAEQTQSQIQEYKIQQYQELFPTDWYYTRFLETGQEVPLEIKQQRKDIREKYNNLIQEINNE